VARTAPAARTASAPTATANYLAARAHFKPAAESGAFTTGGRSALTLFSASPTTQLLGHILDHQHWRLASVLITNAHYPERSVT
jgi:hypothetical protein